ncbi:MAG TPA: hypothetical protein VJL29_12010 [Thermoguttaceae bacterium]|nr:hypothetical protein [Thermoguttaceae bacterium]
MVMTRFRLLRIPAILLRRVALFGLLGALMVSALGGRVSAQSVWELTPYRIRLIVALSPTATLNPSLAAKLRQGLVQRAETVVGAQWDVQSFEPGPVLSHRMTADLAAVGVKDLPEDTTEFDKVFLLAVVPEASGCAVVARELDVRTETFGPILRRTVWQTAKLRDTAFGAMIDIFTPLAQIATSTSKEVTMRLRAGQLPMRDPSLRGVRPGDVFQPIMRFSDREGKLLKRGVVPWTFFVVDQCDAKVFRATIHSAMLSPMSGRRRGRVEALALAVRPHGHATRVVFTGRVEPKPRLAGYPIYDQKIGSKETTYLGRTGIDGGIEVGPGRHPMRLLLVKSGKALLARLPVVPGLEPELTAEIRDDDQRLEAEGFNTAMQYNLIDLATRQKILIARAKTFLDNGEFDKASKLVEELQAMPTQETMLRDLGNQEDKISVEDAWTKKKVEELFAETRALLKKHLTDGPVKELQREVAAAARAPRETVTPAN